LKNFLLESSKRGDEQVSLKEKVSIKQLSKEFRGRGKTSDIK